MMVTTNPEVEVSPGYQKFLPIITYICCAISIVLFIGINMEGTLDNWDVYRKWGSPSVVDISNGSYWGLITSNFLHTSPIHIAFNLYWILIFGKKIEFESGKINYVVLILTAALASSLMQLSFSDSPGIGLSGIGYGFFGFLLIKMRTDGAYKDFLSKRIILLFIVWLFLCILLTKTKILEIANGGHFGGLLWGMAFAFGARLAIWKQVLGGVLILTFVGSSIFWNPLSISHLVVRAYELHLNEQVPEAMEAYRMILERDPSSEFAITNLRILEIHLLRVKAFELLSDFQYEEARKVYLQILEIDPKNEWAMENLRRLPLKESVLPNAQFEFPE